MVGNDTTEHRPTFADSLTNVKTFGTIRGGPSRPRADGTPEDHGSGTECRAVQKCANLVQLENAEKNAY